MLSEKAWVLKRFPQKLPAKKIQPSIFLVPVNHDIAIAAREKSNGSSKSDPRLVVSKLLNAVGYEACQIRLAETQETPLLSTESGRKEIG